MFRLTSPCADPARQRGRRLGGGEASLEASSGRAGRPPSSKPGPTARQLRYMAPLKVQESCLGCHAKQGYQVGDIRGGLSVSQHYGRSRRPADGIRQSALAHGRPSWWCWRWAGAARAAAPALAELAGKIGRAGEAHGQLLQSEKMAAIGVLAAGVAHEINNPVGFVGSNLGTPKSYSEEMVALWRPAGPGGRRRRISWPPISITSRPTSPS